MLDRGKEKGKKERQEERISGDTRSARVRPKGHHPGDTFGSTLLGSLRVSCSLPHPRDVHFCSLARLQGQRNMGWSARKWRNYIRGREKGGCKSKRRLLLSLSLRLSMFSRDGGRRGTRTRYLSKRSFEKDIDPVGNRRDDASIDRGRSHLPSFGNLKIGHGRL